MAKLPTRPKKSAAKAEAKAPATTAATTKAPAKGATMEKKKGGKC